MARILFGFDAFMHRHVIDIFEYFDLRSAVFMVIFSRKHNVAEYILENYVFENPIIEWAVKYRPKTCNIYLYDSYDLQWIFKLRPNSVRNLYVDLLDSDFFTDDDGFIVNEDYLFWHFNDDPFRSVTKIWIGNSLNLDIVREFLACLINHSQLNHLTTLNLINMIELPDHFVRLLIDSAQALQLPLLSSVLLSVPLTLQEHVDLFIYLDIKNWFMASRTAEIVTFVASKNIQILYLGAMSSSFNNLIPLLEEQKIIRVSTEDQLTLGFLAIRAPLTTRLETYDPDKLPIKCIIDDDDNDDDDDDDDDDE